MENPPPLPFNPYAAPNADIAIKVAIESTEPLASRSSRLGASFLDNLVVFAAVVPSSVLTFVLPRKETGVAFIVASLLAVMSYQWYLISTTGRSLGKRWCGLKIVRNDGAPLTFMTGVVLREWLPFALRIIPGLGTLLGVVDPLFVFFDDRRCIHDHIAGTRVIEAR